MSVGPKTLAPPLLFTACAAPPSDAPSAAEDTAIICTMDDPKSVMVGQFLDLHAKGDLRFADEMFTDDVSFYWVTREAPFNKEEWRAGMELQHRVFKDIEPSRTSSLQGHRVR